jgi:hypothetical protein
MTPLARRGRVWYAILATLVVLEASWRIYNALTSEAGQANWLRSLSPAFFIAGMIWLWWGERWLRRTMAVALLIQGVTMLLPVGVVALQTWKLEPSDVREFLLQVMALVAGIVLLHAGLYFVAGLMLLFSRSVCEFLDYEPIAMEEPDYSDYSEEELLERVRIQEPFAELTREKLESLPDSELVNAVNDHVHFKLNFEEVPMSSLTRGCQSACAIRWCEADVYNGGFYQFFYNKGVEVAFMALEGYKLCGAPRHAELLARAIDIYLREEPEQMEVLADDSLPLMHDFVAGCKASSLPELDDEFYQLDEPTGASDYIRAHLDEFVSQ